MKKTKLTFQPLSFYEKIVKSLLRSIRGPRSQQEMSQIMGYEFNQWHKWESGQKLIKWMDFVQICNQFKLPLETAICIVLGVTSVDINDGGSVFEEVWRKFGNLSSAEMQEFLGISKAQLRRIIFGEQDFVLQILFKILGDFGSSLPYLVETLGGKNIDAHFEKENSLIKRQVEIEGSHPWFCALEALLLHKDYKSMKSHDNSFFAAKLGVNVEEVKRAFSTLEKNGSIEMVNQKYQLRLLRVDMDVSAVNGAKLSKFWTNVCADRFSTIDGIPSSGKGWSYRIFPVSHKAQEQIRKMIRQIDSEIYSILLNDENEEKDFVQVLITHYFDNNEFSKLNILKKLE